jgi:hypothetical protein
MVHHGPFIDDRLPIGRQIVFASSTFFRSKLFPICGRKNDLPESGIFAQAPNILQIPTGYTREAIMG